jgi:3-oxoacyl-[acyl-carrier-protein] synthase II
MAEGAGVLVLESLEHARRRGAHVLAEIRGFGTSGDAHHITQPCPQARGPVLAMERALARSGLSAEDVNYINAHATSTPQGDASEQRAVAQVLFRFPPCSTASTRDHPQKYPRVLNCRRILCESVSLCPERACLV